MAPILTDALGLVRPISSPREGRGRSPFSPLSQRRAQGVETGCFCNPRSSEEPYEGHTAVARVAVRWYSESVN